MAKPHICCGASGSVPASVARGADGYIVTFEVACAKGNPPARGTIKLSDKTLDSLRGGIPADASIGERPAPVEKPRKPRKPRETQPPVTTE